MHGSTAGLFSHTSHPNQLYPYCNTRSGFPASAPPPPPPTICHKRGDFYLLITPVGRRRHPKAKGFRTSCAIISAILPMSGFCYKTETKTTMHQTGVGVGVDRAVLKLPCTKLTSHRENNGGNEECDAARGDRVSGYQPAARFDS